MSADPAALVLGCAGTGLSDDERAFFRDADPLGFILFKRNVDHPEQVRALVTDLRAATGRHAPILIDQEGGRVARLRGVHWPELPAARTVGNLPDAQATRAAWLHGRLLAATLSDLGIDVDCAPVADVPVPGAHDVIGDRAFAMDPERVARLAGEQAAGLLAGGVMPVVKHVPGHGRAFADSHKELPIVTTARDELERWDFAPFRALGRLPAAMVAHVVFTTLDPDRPASVSPTVISDIIRDHIGFDGVLFSDDLSMQALSGTVGQRAAAVLAAGCDIALHCNGQMGEMLDVVSQARPMDGDGIRRWAVAVNAVPPTSPVDIPALRAELDRLLNARGA